MTSVEHNRHLAVAPFRWPRSLDLIWAAILHNDGGRGRSRSSRTTPSTILVLGVHRVLNPTNPEPVTAAGFRSDRPVENRGSRSASPTPLLGGASDRLGQDRWNRLPPPRSRNHEASLSDPLLHRIEPETSTSTPDAPPRPPDRYLDLDPHLLEDAPLSPPYRICSDPSRLPVRG